jgi:hypothetical protein
MTLVGKGGGRPKLKLAGSQKLKLAGEIRLCQQFHRFKNAAQAFRRDHMNDRLIVSRDRDKSAAFSRAYNRGGFSLKIFNAVCISHT